MTTDIELLRFTLIRHLSKYLLKEDLRIRHIFQIMKNQLERKEQISIKMFNSVLSFIEREYQFKNHSRKELRKLFSPIIDKTPKKSEIQSTSTLEQFFV